MDLTNDLVKSLGDSIMKERDRVASLSQTEEGRTQLQKEKEIRQRRNNIYNELMRLKIDEIDCTLISDEANKEKAIILFRDFLVKFLQQAEVCAKLLEL